VLARASLACERGAPSPPPGGRASAVDGAVGMTPCCGSVGERDRPRPRPLLSCVILSGAGKWPALELRAHLTLRPAAAEGHGPGRVQARRLGAVPQAGGRAARRPHDSTFWPLDARAAAVANSASLRHRDCAPAFAPCGSAPLQLPSLVACRHARTAGAGAGAGAGPWPTAASRRRKPLWRPAGAAAGRRAAVGALGRRPRRASGPGTPAVWRHAALPPSPLPPHRLRRLSGNGASPFAPRELRPGARDPRHRLAPTNLATWGRAAAPEGGRHRSACMELRGA
jgi:hypothetical protein